MLNNVEFVYDRLVSAVHEIAKNDPESLDLVLTDYVLELVIKDLDEKMKQYFDFCILNKGYAESCNSGLHKTMFEANLRELLGHYTLYLIYVQSVRSRGIQVELKTDIEAC